MNPNLLKKLKDWRDGVAKKEAVEGFRVLPNRSIEDIARMEPKTREELISIKGIKDKKYYKYGKEILDIVKSESRSFRFEHNGIRADSGDKSSSTEGRNSIIDPLENKKQYANFQKKMVYSVSQFLDMINDKLLFENARLKGEITSLDEREKVIYFSLKDSKDESMINCLIFRYQYEISGVKLEVGKEIVAGGYPQIYKPTGRLSLKVDVIEIAGEGALKKAYDELKQRLEREGLFSAERKKQMPELPETVGLITSSQGAAIGDFTTNIGNYGFKIKFINSSVEGKQAVFDLIKAVRTFKSIGGIDVLAIVRGGGSLESLQAFNNEALVKEITGLKIPVVCGVGHEKDISLVSLASDLSVSTPTAAARAIRESWDKARQKLIRCESSMISGYESSLSDQTHQIDTLSYTLTANFDKIAYRFESAINNFNACFQKISSVVHNTRKNIGVYKSQMFSGLERMIAFAKEQLKATEYQIKLNDPARQLRLGYSISKFEGKIIRSVRQIKKGDKIRIDISDGKFGSVVDSITENSA